MAKVRFNLRENSGKDCHIQLVYRLQGDNKKLVLGTKLHVPKKYWNMNSMRVKETSEFYEHVKYNLILDRWEQSVNEVRIEYHVIGKQPSLAEFREAVKKKMIGENTLGVDKRFLAYFQSYIENKKKTKASLSTIKQYQNAYNLFESFLKVKKKGITIEFSDLKKPLILDFIQYLENDKNHQQNTIHKTIKRIRSVLNDATEKGLNSLLDYKDKDCQLPYIKQPKICVFETELDLILNLDLKEKSRLDQMRDRFIVGFYTALRFSDLMNLSVSHITKEHKIDVLKIRTSKTKEYVTIPLKPIVREILLKYDGKLPTISLQKFNDYLKELFKLANVNVRVARTEDNKEVFYEKWELVSSHTMRRSFATNAILRGINPELVRRITGHGSIKQLYEYVCVDSKEFLNFASDNGFFK